MTYTIREIKQLRNGVQERAYADHIYQWEIVLDGKAEYDEMLAFCQTYLRKSARTSDEYRAATATAKGFEALMEVVVGGRFELTPNKFNNKWTYTVTEDYID